jgi:anti-sigma B factor antagonist
MELTTHSEADVKVIEISGTLDSSNVGEFREKFLEESNHEDRIVLDCSALDYMDSSGLATLVNIFKNLSAREIPLVICGFSEGILRVIEFTNLDKVFKLAGSLEEALAAAKS